MHASWLRKYTDHLPACVLAFYNFDGALQVGQAGADGMQRLMDCIVRQKRHCADYGVKFSVVLMTDRVVFDGGVEERVQWLKRQCALTEKHALFLCSTRSDPAEFVNMYALYIYIHFIVHI